MELKVQMGEWVSNLHHSAPAAPRKGEAQTAAPEVRQQRGWSAREVCRQQLPTTGIWLRR